jgi:hypothetical protein
MRHEFFPSPILMQPYLGQHWNISTACCHGVMWALLHITVCSRLSPTKSIASASGVPTVTAGLAGSRLLKDLGVVPIASHSLFSFLSNRQVVVAANIPLSLNNHV